MPSGLRHCERPPERVDHFEELRGQERADVGDDVFRQKALRKALSLDPNDPVTRAKLGSTLSKLGRFDEAIPEYRKAISLKPDLADAYLGLGIAYLQEGNRREAARQVAPLRKLDKDRATELQNLLEQFR